MSKYIKDLITEHEEKQDNEMKNVQAAIAEAEGDDRGYVIRKQEETLNDAARGIGANTFRDKPKQGWGAGGDDDADDGDEWQDTSESSPEELKAMFANLTAE